MPLLIDQIKEAFAEVKKAPCCIQDMMSHP